MRPDIVMTQTGYKIVELNISSSVGGYPASLLVDEYFSKHPALQALEENFQRKLSTICFEERFPRLLKEVLTNDRLILWDVLNFPVKELEDRTLTDQWIKILKKEFKVSELSGFTNRKKLAREIDNLPAHANLFRIFHPTLIDESDPLYAKMLHSIKNKIIRDVSSLSEIIYSNKILLADIELYIDCLAQQKIATRLRATLPESYEIDSEFKKFYDWDKVIEEKDSFVLKQGCSFASQAVYIGKLTAPQNWKKTLTMALEMPGWTLQKYFCPIRQFDMAFSGDDLIQSEREVELGPYFINSEIAGFFCRSKMYIGRTPFQTSSTATVIYE